MNAKLNNQSKHKENRLFCTRFIRFLIALAAMTVSTTSAWGETKSIKYLTYNGSTIVEPYSSPVNAEAITSSSTSLSAGWYYVEGEVTISSTVTLSDDTHLILCDGATLTINALGGFSLKDSKNLSIYAQSSGALKGKLIINANRSCIAGYGNVTINGGNLNFTSTTKDCIYGVNNFTVNGGKVDIVTSATGGDGIFPDGAVTINGGTVSTTGSHAGIYIETSTDVTINGGKYSASGGSKGIDTNGAIYLGWTNASDFIKANSYSATSIDARKNFYIDGSTPLAAANDIAAATINDKTLTPKTDAPIYTISLDEGVSADNVEFDKAKAFAGERVAITVTPPTGQILTSLTYSDGSNTYTIGTNPSDIKRQANDYVITMPAANVTVNATFATPVAQIGDTKYPTLQAAFDAVPDGGATTIDILREITEATTARGNWDNPNITLNLNGNDVTIGGMTNLANLSIYGNGGTMTVKNSFGISNANSDNTDQLLVDKATIIIEDGIQWMAEKIKLQNNAKVTIYNNFYLGYSTEELSVNIDNGSWMKLISCTIGATNGDQAKAALLPLVCPDLREAFTVPGTYGTASEPYYLRGSWGIELKNGLSNATTTFYDGGTSFDPTAFSPSAYTTSTLYVDNSDDQDHYVIAHIVPEFFYWTDLSLLSAVETGTSLTGDANALTLLKRDQYDAAISGDPDMRDRYDGAGWYYYTLPKGHSVAAGYTTSTLGGEVVPQFDLAADDKTVFSHDFDNNTLTISRTTDTWKATLTYDKLSWKFTGSFALSDLPKLQSISFKKGDTEMFSQNDADALAGQIKNAYQIEQVGIGDNYLYLQAVVYGCFFQSDYLNSKYKILVPFDGDGSDTNPWQIKTAADLSLLAKCVNVGAHPFEGQDLKLTSATYDMSGSDFEPIGTFSNLPFKGKLNCNGATISNITYAYDTPEGLAVTDETPIPAIGLVGNLVGTVENARLESCSFSSESDSENCYVGSIAGFAKSGSVKDCYVIGGNVSVAKTGSHTGAIVGKLGAATLTNNYYDYTTTATLGSSTASGYTKRGLWMGTASSDGGPTTYAWNDFTLNDGAVLWVKKATISETKPTGSTSSVAFSQTTKGVNRYDKDGDDFYYAVNQPLTLTVTEGQSTADALRTFYDGLSSLTVNGSSDGVDLANRSFSMPEADATIAATFTPSNWFTIPSNGKMWMSFYHEWKDANNEPVNYTVTAYGNTSNSRTRAVTNQLELLTIKKDGIDLDAGTATTLDLGGISFNGVPTLLHQEGGLPERLRFDPVAGQTAPQYDPQFVGGVSDLTPYTQKSVFMLFNSELVRADLSGDASGGSIMADPHRAFIVVSDAPATSRLMLISDDATGIHSIDKSTTDDADGAWYGIDGRRLQGKPTKRGLYIVNGKKMVIK